MAATAVAQHSSREAYMRYVGVARDQGWEKHGRSLRNMAGALMYLALEPEW